jgi:hypothetical protein
MVQVGQHLPFMTKSLQDELAVQPRTDNLYRHSPLKDVIGPRRKVHTSHTAASNFLVNLISPKPLTEHRIIFFFSFERQQCHSRLVKY